MVETMRDRPPAPLSKALPSRRVLREQFFGQRAKEFYTERFSLLTSEEMNAIIKDHKVLFKNASVRQFVGALLQGALHEANAQKRNIAQ